MNVMPLRCQRPDEDFVTRSLFSSFGKNEKLHFLKAIQSIYLRKSNSVCCMKEFNKALTFNITNRKGNKACRICFCGNKKGLSLSIIF